MRAERRPVVQSEPVDHHVDPVGQIRVAVLPFIRRAIHHRFEELAHVRGELLHLLEHSLGLAMHEAADQTVHHCPAGHLRLQRDPGGAEGRHRSQTVEPSSDEGAIGCDPLSGHALEVRVQIGLESRRVDTGSAAAVDSVSDAREDVVEVHAVGLDAVLVRRPSRLVFHRCDVI